MSRVEVLQLVSFLFTDVSYARRQLDRFRDVPRALDALDRVAGELSRVRCELYTGEEPDEWAEFDDEEWVLTEE